jgi:hypothetical protein
MEVLVFSKTTISRMTNTQAEARPLRMGIRKNQQPQKTINFPAILKSITLPALVVLVATASVSVVKHISTLRAQRDMLKSQLQDQVRLQADNTMKVAFFESALRKTVITSYVPQLGGINGGGKVYANGEPVIPIAASRKALKSGSVRMGDFVLLVGQIKDTKGEGTTEHSFDVQAPSAEIASMIGKRPYTFVNLSSKGSPYSKMLPGKK